MKKHALALAVLLTPAAALANPTLYGQFNVSLDNVDNGTTDFFQLESNSSRIGIKGEADTSVEGLKALYTAEFGVNVDDGAGPFSQRNIFVGLKGGFGTLRAGKIDSPLKDAQGKVDQFNDLAGDIQNLVGGENRNDNIIYYSSPKLGEAVTLNLALIPAENTNVDGQAGNETGLTDTISTSAVYQSGNLYLAAAIDQDQALGGYSPDAVVRGDLVRLVATYKLDNLDLGLLYATAESNGAVALEDTGWLLSAAYNRGDWKFKAQYGVNEGDSTGTERTLASIGADYKLGKNTTAYGYYTQRETDTGTVAELNTWGLGLNQRF